MTPDPYVDQRDSLATGACNRSGTRRFTLICLAQIVSLAGSHLTAFGLGVWAYQRTESTTIYGWIALATFGPGILASPFAGALVDRATRLTMIAGHAGAGLCSLSLAILVHFDALRIEAALAFIAIASVCNSVQFPALWSAIPRLVMPEFLGRANGAVQFGAAFNQVIVPPAAAIFLASGGIWTILIIDVLTFLFAIILLLVVRIPPAARTEAIEARPRRLLEGVGDSWLYIRARSGFLWLLALSALINFNLGMAQVLVTPLVLSFADIHALGLVRSLGGLGMILGGGLLMLWGGPRRQVNGVLCFALLESLSLLLLGGMSPSVIQAAICAFGVLFAIPLVVGCRQTIWQRKVRASIQGRVFALEAMISQAMIPFAFVLAGPLADRIFEPLMSYGGPLSSSVGEVLGAGPGRGVGLLLVIVGLLGIFGVALAATSRSLRCLEELPDDGLAVPGDPDQMVPRTHAQTVR